MRITTHGFRHTHRLLLFEAGVSLKEAQDRLGHIVRKNIKNMYAHVSKKKIKRGVEKLCWCRLLEARITKRIKKKRQKTQNH